MNTARHLILALCVFTVVQGTVFSQDSGTKIQTAWKTGECTLWENGAPNALGKDAKDVPKMLLYPADAKNRTGTAVVVCPGGGYGGLAMDHEGDQIGKWFQSIGISAFIVDYRHRGKGYGHPNPLLDAQRAIRTVRAKAKEWNVDANKIGVMGFSAGGHLASTVGTHFDDGDAANADPVEKMSSRPDFMILCYPVIQFDTEKAHTGSQRNLLGENAPKELIESLSNEKMVTERTPPTFLFQTDEDTVVPAENAVSFYLALRKHKVPAEMHIYQKGRHGIGLAKGMIANETWPELCRLWIEATVEKK